MILERESKLPRPDEFAQSNFALVVRRLADDLAFGSDTSRFLGSGLEYASSRPYQPGDSLRTINWRLTARSQQAFVKEYESLKRTCVYIVVDTSASMLVSSVSLSKLHAAIWIASALSLVAQRRLSPVSVIGASERGPAGVRLRKSASLSRHDLWQDLEQLRLADYTGRARLAQELREVCDRAQRASMIIAISDWHEPEAMNAMKRAAQQHDCIALQLSDPAEVQQPRAGFYRAQESESGQVFFAAPRLRKRGLVEQYLRLKAGGVDHLSLQTDKPFIAPLRHFISTRGLAKGGKGA